MPHIKTDAIGSDKNRCAPQLHCGGFLNSVGRAHRLESAETRRLAPLWRRRIENKDPVVRVPSPIFRFCDRGKNEKRAEDNYHGIGQLTHVAIVRTSLHSCTERTDRQTEGVCQQSAATVSQDISTILCSICDFNPAVITTLYYFVSVRTEAEMVRGTSESMGRCIYTGCWPYRI